jgi:hypothetical protein
VQACAHPAVDVIGHPARHIEGLRGMDWPGLFRMAAETGTAIEVNANNYPDGRHEPGRERFWAEWLQELERSGADVFLGSDIHNRIQRERFVSGWRTLGDPHRPNALAECAVALAEAGIEPRRVVNADYRRFLEWLALDKRARANVLAATMGALV